MKASGPPCEAVLLFVSSGGSMPAIAPERNRSTLRARLFLGLVVLVSLLGGFATPASASEAELVMPDLSSVNFLGGINGHSLLLGGLVVCVLGMVFGLVIYTQLKNMPVHKSMRAVSELIFETCKTYLVTQGKFILILEAFIGAVIVVYFGWLRHFEPVKVVIILLFSLIGLGGRS